MKAVVFAVLVLALPATASAQDETYSLRWTFGVGPSRATTSGNKLTLTGSPGCFNCGRNFQRVTGADNGKYHASFNVAGDIRFNLTLRGELNYSHATSVRSTISAKYCPPPGIYKCYQDRKSLEDNQWYLGGGVEYTPLKKIPIMPYVASTGGLSLNFLTWNWDSTVTSTEPNRHAKAFGSYASGGLGVRARVKSALAFVETRRFLTFSTPGAAMTAYSVGLQYWLHFRNYGY